METFEGKLVLGLPKGSLEAATCEIFRKAGYTINISSRSYYPTINDPDIKPILIRSQEMSRYVEAGHLDCGICGHDWIVENQSDVVEICEMMYSKATANPVRWVLCVHNDSPCQKPEDLEGKLIATEAVNMTKKYFVEKGINVNIEFSWGATEVKCPNLVDAIVELTETGSSLRANNLRIIDTLTTSTTRFIANKEAMKDPFKREKIENLATLLQGALRARDKVGLKLNAPLSKLEEISAKLPCMREPTISPLKDKDWVAMEVVLDEITSRDLIPQLKALGAQDIIEYPLSKVIP